MSERMSSCLRQAAAYLSAGIVGYRGYGQRQPRRNRIAAHHGPVVAASENLENRLLLAGADITVISAAGTPGDTVDVPIQVTKWTNPQPSDRLGSFQLTVEYETMALDLTTADVSLGTFFTQAGWTFIADVQDDTPTGGLVTVTANSPTNQPTQIPDSLPNLVQLNFSISPSAANGGAYVQVLEGPGVDTAIFSNGQPLNLVLLAGDVTVSGGSDNGGGPGDGGGGPGDGGGGPGDGDGGPGDGGGGPGDGGGGGGGPTEPVASDDIDVGGFATDEDTVLITGNVLDNDFDPYNSPIEVFSFTQPLRGPSAAGGSIVSRGDGTFTFDPQNAFADLPAGQIDYAVFRYKIKNQTNGVSNEAVVQILVSGINDAPSISAIANQTMPEDGILSNLSFTVSDPDSSTLAVDVTSTDPTLFPFGSLSLSGSGNNRQLSVTPAANLSGQATVTLTVFDGSISSSTSFVVTVQAVNDAPEISDITGKSTDEDTPILNIPFSVSDIDSGLSSLTITVSSNAPTLFPAGSLILGGSGSNRLLSILPAADRSGQATVTVTVSDGDKTDSTSFDIFVNAVNDPPFISDVDNQTTSEDVPITGIPLTVIDVDDVVDVTFSSSNSILLPPGSVVVSGTGTSRTLSITPAANKFGNADVTLTVNDGQAFDQTVFSVSVSSVNDAPSISSIGTQTVLEDGVLSNIPFTILDQDDDELSLSVSTSNPALLPLEQIVLSGTGGNRQISITPTAGLSGSGTVTIFVTDGTATTSTVFTVQVTPVNDAPLISSISDQTVDEDATLAGIPFTISDEDSVNLTVTASTNNSTLLPPGSVSITGVGGNRQVFITPAANKFGSAVVSITVSDGEASATSTFNLTVNSVNDAPTAVADSTSVPADGSVVISVLGNDIDIDGTLIPGSVEIVAVPASGTVVANPNGTITFTPETGSSGIAFFSYRVADNEGEFSLPATVSVNVITNARPVIEPIAAQSLSVGGASVKIPLSITDADGDPLQITVTSDVTGVLSSLTLSGTGSSRTLQLVPGTRPGVAQVTITAADGVTAPVTRTFAVSVGLLIDAGASRATSGVLTHRGYANSVAIPFSTSLNITGVPVGVPASLFRTNVFDNPGGPELLFTIPTVAGQVYDVDLLFSEIWSGAFGVGRRVFNVKLEGSLAIEKLDVFAAVGRNHALTRTFQVTGDGNLSVELLRITQNPNISGIRIRPSATPNTAPTISTVAAQQTSEDTPLTGIAFSVADAEEQPLTVTVASADSQLLPATGLVLTGTGANRQLAITPAANRFGTTQVTLSVSDGRVTTSTAFTVTVNSVNDIPVATGDNATTMVNTAVTIPVLSNDSDLDGTLNPASVAIAQQSANGTAVPNANGTISFTPNLSFSGTATFTYTVRDDAGGESQPATVSVLVRSNAAPVISEIAAIQLNVGTSSAPIPFQVTDSDGDSLVVTVTTADSQIARTPTIIGVGSNRQLTVAAGDLVGMTTITITVTDNVNAPVTRTVNVSAFALIDVGASRPTPGAILETAFQNGAGLRFSGASPVTTAAGTLAASVPDLFYRSTLFDPPGGRELGFDINAKSGQLFAVDLFFAEVWGGAFGQGRRVFDVNIDGETVLNDFDVFKEAGGGNIGIARRFVINSDGRIDIDLQRVIQNPMLSGLRVTPLGKPPET